MAVDPWSACPSSQAAEPGRSGSDLPCCVHVADDGEGAHAHHISFFCCWCGTAVAEQAVVLPRRAWSGRRHGPVARGCRPARRSDVPAVRGPAEPR